MESFRAGIIVFKKKIILTGFAGPEGSSGTDCILYTEMCVGKLSKLKGGKTLDQVQTERWGVGGVVKNQKSPKSQFENFKIERGILEKQKSPRGYP